MKGHKKHSLPFLAGQYITRLFAKKLSTDLVFHNFQHTVNVVRGVRDICKNTDVSKEDREILFLAAWFHDSGHTVTYEGHEKESQKIAEAWLREKKFPENKIKQVLACIAATQLPQQPTNLLEQIMCDSDLYHLSLPEYVHLQFQLREEFRRVFEKSYTDEEWMLDNMKFINSHHYWTKYGATVLRPRKLVNLEKCGSLAEERRL